MYWGLPRTYHTNALSLVQRHSHPRRIPRHSSRLSVSVLSTGVLSARVCCAQHVLVTTMIKAQQTSGTSPATQLQKYTVRNSPTFLLSIPVEGKDRGKVGSVGTNKHTPKGTLQTQHSGGLTTDTRGCTIGTGLKILRTISEKRICSCSIRNEQA